MTMRQIKNWARKAILGGGVAAGALLSWTGTQLLYAQAPPATPAVQRNYLNKKVIRLPIEMEAKTRQSIQEIQLYVKESAGAPWTLRDKVSASQESFTYQAPRDGEYWFAMVTVDRQGRSFPADVRNEPPGLIVVIDTQAPAITLSNLGETPIGTLIQCEINDPHLDNGKARLSFQGGDKVFRDMPAVPGRANVFCIPFEAVCTGLIRVSASDLAGNQGFREQHLNDMKAVQGAKKTTPPVTQNASTQPPRSIPDLLPKNLEPVPLPEPTRRRETGSIPKTPDANPHQQASYRPSGADGPRFAVNTTSTAEPAPLPKHQAAKPVFTPAPTNRQLVNSPRVFLDYQIENAGSSGVGRVEVWITRDQGKSWEKLMEQAQTKSPLEARLPGDGLFGVTLMVSNGRGIMAASPKAGDAPDGWIEVDATEPVARITSARCEIEKGRAVVLIDWTSEDKNSKDGAIELSYGPTAQGPWLPIAKNLNAKGQHRWLPPETIGAQAHIRLVAKDAAGNAAITSTLEPVLLTDPARPRAVLRGIRTSATASPTIPIPARVAPAPLVIPEPVMPPPLEIIQPPPR